MMRRIRSRRRGRPTGSNIIFLNRFLVVAVLLVIALRRWW